MPVPGSATPPGTSCRITRQATGPVRACLMLHVAADSAQPFVDALHRLPAHACRRTPGGHWWVTPTHRPTLILLVHGFDHAWLIEGDQQTDLKTGRRS